jgi:glycosyltransferase involved in cell wall biosynthesis
MVNAKYKGKILFVSNTSWSLYNFRKSVMISFREKGYEVVAVAPEDKFSSMFSELGINYSPIKIDNKGMNPFRDIFFCWKCFRLYKKYKPDLIFHYTVKPNIFGTIAAKMAGFKSVAVVSGTGFAFSKKGLLNWIVKSLYRVSARFSLQFWFINNDDCELFIDEKIIQKEKTIVLPGEGIDTHYFKKDGANRDWKANKVFKFILTGRMIWEKGVGVYAEAAAILKAKFENVEFQLLGFLDAKNPLAIPKAEIEKWQRLNLVNYLGDTDNVKEFLIQSDCMVLPSYYKEGVPRSLLEGASLELPIITTDNVGCKEVVEDGVNGFLCNVRDITDLANKMEMMINLTDEQRMEMGKKGRQKILNKFDDKFVIAKYHTIVEKYVTLNN